MIYKKIQNKVMIKAKGISFLKIASWKKKRKKNNSFVMSQIIKYQTEMRLKLQKSGYMLQRR